MALRPTTNDLIRFVEQSKGKLISTAGGRARFRVDVIPEGLCYTPESSGKPRKQKRERLDRILAHFHDTHSLSPSDYMDITRHSSYALGVIKAVVGTK